MTGLHARLLEAHARGDRSELVRLYTEASDVAADRVAQAFYLTHAYVFALEAGDAQADALRQRLVELGAEPA